MQGHSALSTALSKAFRSIRHAPKILIALKKTQNGTSEPDSNSSTHNTSQKMAKNPQSVQIEGEMGQNCDSSTRGGYFPALSVRAQAARGGTLQSHRAGAPFEVIGREHLARSFCARRGHIAKSFCGSRLQRHRAGAHCKVLLR